MGERMAMNLELPPDVKAALILLAERQERSQAGVIRVLTREAAARELETSNPEPTIKLAEVVA